MNDLNIKDFFREVVIPTTPEDERDSTFFELVEWANSGFSGVPSVDVQRLVDKTIPVWLESHSCSDFLICQIENMDRKKLALKASIIAVEYAVEKTKVYTTGPEIYEALKLINQFYEDEASVSLDKLQELEDRIWSLEVINTLDGDAIYALYRIFFETRDGESGTSSVFWATQATSDEEILRVIIEKLPKFCYEDLLCWGYFSSQAHFKW